LGREDVTGNRRAGRAEPGARCIPGLHSYCLFHISGTDAPDLPASAAV